MGRLSLVASHLKPPLREGEESNFHSSSTETSKCPSGVIPAKAGIHFDLCNYKLDPGFPG